MSGATISGSRRSGGGDRLAGRFIIQSYAVARSGGVSAGYVNIAILALLTLGLALALVRAREGKPRR